MLLTCPDCRSGLEVPDGTTALVRCPACKTVFSPADSPPPQDEEDEDDAEEEEAPRAKKRKPARDDDDEEEDLPRKKRGKRKRRDEDEDEEEAASQNRDFDPLPEDDEPRRKKRPRKADDSGLTPEEKAARRNAFDRAAVGCKLIWASFGFFLVSMLFFNVYFFQSAFTEPSGAIIVFAGLLGVLNWLCAAVGVGMCLSGPPAPGHWRYGIGAAVATVVHLLMLLVLVGQGREFAVGKEHGEGGIRWGMIPTQLNSTMFYLTAIVYPEDQGFTPRGPLVLSMLTGIAEMVRTLFIMMLLSCLARAALDDDLAHQCTRCAGIASAGPGLLALIIFVFVAFLIETNAGMNMYTRIVFLTVRMGIYTIVTGVIVPSYFAAREVADACDEPFQSLIPKL